VRRALGDCTHTACRREPGRARTTAPATAAPGNNLLFGNGRRGPGGDITYRADQFDFTADGLLELRGNVDVHMGDREIMADRLTYDRNNNNLTAAGAVRYRDPIVLLQGDTGHYNEQSADSVTARSNFSSCLATAPPIRYR